MSKRARVLVAVGWVVAGLSLLAYASVLWDALRGALLPRVHIDGTAVPAGVAADRSGVVVALTTTGTIDVGCGDPSTLRGMVLVRYDSAGKCVWKKPIAGAGALDVAAAPSGETALAADVYENADFGFGPTPSFASFVVASYDASGKPRWSRSLDGRVLEVPAQRSRHVVAIAPDGSLVATLVATHNGADLGAGKLATRNTAHDAAVVLLDGASGATRAVRYLGSLSFGGVAVSPSGEVLVIGSFTGEATLGTETWSAAEGDNGEVFVAKLDANGRTTFAKHFGLGDGTCIAGASDGRVFIAGAYAHTAPDLGPNALPACAGSACAFIAELDASGKTTYATAIAAATPRAIALDSAGKVFVVCDRESPRGPLLARIDRGALFGLRADDVKALDKVDDLTLDASNRAVIAGRSTSGPHVGAGVRWVLP